MQNKPSFITPLVRHAQSLGLAAGASLLLAGSTAWAQQQPPQQPQQPPRVQQPQARVQQQPPPMPMGVQQEVRELRQEIHGLRTNYAVGAFSEFVDSYQQDQRFKNQADHYVQRGLRLLSATIGEFITPENAPLNQQHQQLTQRISQVSEMSADQRQPGVVRDLIVETTNLLVNVQQQYYPQFAQQTQQLRTLAQQITPQALSGQAERVNQFFQNSSLVLERMAQSPTDVIGGGPIEDPPTMMDGQDVESMPPKQDTAPGKDEDSEDY